MTIQHIFVIIGLLIIVAIIAGAFYFFNIVPKRKRSQSEREFFDLDIGKIKSDLKQMKLNVIPGRLLYGKSLGSALYFYAGYLVMCFVFMCATVFQLTDVDMGQIALWFIILAFFGLFSFAAAYYLCFGYTLFKYGAAHYIHQGDRLVELLKAKGIKYSKIFFLVNVVIATPIQALWIAGTFSVLLISFISVFILNAVISQEFIRLGLPNMLEIAREYYNKKRDILVEPPSGDAQK